MRKKRTEMPVCFLSEQENAPQPVLTLTKETVASVVLYAAIFGLALYGSLALFLNVFQLRVHLFWIITAVTAFYGILTLIFSYAKGKQNLWLLAPILLMAGIGLVFQKTLIQGICRYLNKLFLMLNQTTYWVFPNFPIEFAGSAKTVSQNTMAVCFLFFWLALLIGYAVVRRRNVLMLVIFTVAFLWMPIGFRLDVLIPGFFAVFTSYITLYVYDFGTQRKKLGPRPPKEPRRKRLHEVSHRMQTFAVIPLIVLTVISSVILLPQTGYRRPKNISDLRSTVMNFDWRKIDWNSAFGIRFQGFGEGDLQNLGSLNYSGRTVVQIKGEKQETRYLHSFAGAHLNNGKWEAVSVEEYKNAAIKFPHIVPQRLSTMLYEFEEEKAFAWNGSWFQNVADPYVLSVRNVAAKDKIVFLTGFLNSTAAQMGSIEFSGDAQAQMFDDKNQYSMKVYSASNSICTEIYLPDPIANVADYYARIEDFVTYFVGIPNDKTNADGLSFGSFCEEVVAYNRYVYDTYTSLPDNTRQAAEALCQQYKLQPLIQDWTMNVQQTVDRVRNLLQSQCRYSLSPKTVPSNVDFATYFLNESQEGYCVHFATTATVLLRAMGIPARYTEGFVLVPSDFSGTKDEEGYISIKDERAHAWVEVYDPTQLEWIPMEVTPGFSQTIGQVDQTKLPQPTSSIPVSSEPESSSKAASSFISSQKTSSVSSQKTSSLSGTSVSSNSTSVYPAPSGSGEKALSAVVFVLIGVVFIILICFSLRRIAIARRKIKLEQSDINAAIRYGCKYLIAMLRAAGCPAPQDKDTPESYLKKSLAVISWLPRKRLYHVLESGQKARFAEHPCSEEERTEMVELLKELSVQISHQLVAVRYVAFRCRFPRFPQ